MYPSVYPADLASLIIPFIVFLWFTTVWSYQSSLLNPWGRRIPWRRKWQPTPVFLPGKFHGWGSLVDYSPWGCKARTQTAFFIFLLPPSFPLQCRVSALLRLFCLWLAYCGSHENWFLRHPTRRKVWQRLSHYSLKRVSPMSPSSYRLLLAEGWTWQGYVGRLLLRRHRDSLMVDLGSRTPHGPVKLFLGCREIRIFSLSIFPSSDLIGDHTCNAVWWLL